MRLLSATGDEIPYILAEHDKEARAIEEQVTDICWYMRGGISRQEAWALSPRERKKIYKLIEKNIDRVNKTGLAIL